jgi:hypothetical protein
MNAELQQNDSLSMGAAQSLDHALLTLAAAAVRPP